MIDFGERELGPHLTDLDKTCQIRSDMEFDIEKDTVLWWKHPDYPDSEPVSMLRNGEMLVITGREKSRKSTLTLSVVSSNFIDDVNRTLGYKLDLDGRPIVRFDTEQPMPISVLNRRTFDGMCGLKAGNEDYLEYNILGYPYFEQIEQIEYEIWKLNKQGRPPGLVIIDQIADLIPASDYNDVENSSIVVNTMLRLQKEYNMSTCNIIHTNRGGQETNGKLGTLLDKKNGCTLRTELGVDDDDKDGEVTTVWHHWARFQRHRPIYFDHDEHWMPRLIRID